MEVLALDALARIAAGTGAHDVAAGLRYQVFQRIGHLPDDSDRYDARLV